MTGGRIHSVTLPWQMARKSERRQSGQATFFLGSPMLYFMQQRDGQTDDRTRRTKRLHDASISNSTHPPPLAHTLTGRRSAPPKKGIVRLGIRAEVGLNSTKRLAEWR